MSSIIDVMFAILDIRNGKHIWKKININLFYVCLRECVFQLLSLHIEINFANHQRENSCWCQIERETCIQHKFPLPTCIAHYISMQIKLTKKPYLIDSLNNLLFWLVVNRSVLCLTDRLYFWKKNIGKRK